MAESECAHHWICETPDGPESVSRCKKCGTEQRFRNTIDEEEAAALRYDGGGVCLPKNSGVLKPVVTDAPGMRDGRSGDGEPASAPGRQKPPRSHEHEWDIADPDDNGVSIMRCRQCRLELRCDAHGELHDETGALVFGKGPIRGETGRKFKDRTAGEKEGDDMARRTPEYWDKRLPDLLKQLEELGSLSALQAALREAGETISYSALEGILVKRNVDVSKYKTGHRKAQPLLPEPPATGPDDEPPDAGSRDGQATRARGSRMLPPAIDALFAMLPVRPEKYPQWRAALLACADLELGPKEYVPPTP